MRAYAVAGEIVKHAINMTIEGAEWGLSGVSMTVEGDGAQIEPFRSPESFYFDYNLVAGHGVRLEAGPLAP